MIDTIEEENLNKPDENSGEKQVQVTVEVNGTAPDADSAPKPRKRRNQENEKLKAELSELNDKYLRARAEFDNYRRRTEKEKLTSVGNGINIAVDALLPVLDTLITASQAECSDPDYKKGVEMIITKFENSLAALGVTEIEALGKHFDPALHNAVSGEDTQDFEHGTIIRVLQKGYRLGDRVIRHAVVTVAQ